MPQINGHIHVGRLLCKRGESERSRAEQQAAPQKEADQQQGENDGEEESTELIII